MSQLSANPSRDDIWNEFASNSRPATNGLLEMHNQIFGSGLYSRDAFGGTGKPVIGNANYSESNIGETSVDVEATVSSFDGGLSEFSYYFQYDTDSNFGSPSTTSTKTSTTATVNETISGLSSGTTYYYRLVVFNGYCNNSNDHVVDSLGNGEFTTASATCNIDAPAVDNAVFQSFGNVRVSWTEPSPTPDNGYNIYYSVNGGSFTFKTNVAVGTTQYDHACSDGDFSNSDDVQWRVVSECGNGVEGGGDNTSVETITTC